MNIRIIILLLFSKFLFVGCESEETNKTTFYLPDGNIFEECEINLVNEELEFKSYMGIGYNVEYSDQSYFVVLNTRSTQKLYLEETLDLKKFLTEIEGEIIESVELNFYKSQKLEFLDSFLRNSYNDNFDISIERIDLPGGFVEYHVIGQDNVKLVMIEIDDSKKTAKLIIQGNVGEKAFVKSH